MLGKLIKHEWKAVSKLLLVLHATIVFLSLLGRFLINLMTNGSLNSIFPTVFLIIYVLGIVGIFFATHLVLIIRFYKSMFTDEGYLTHTLPVRCGTLLLSKGLVYLFWSLINVLTLIASLLILVMHKPMIEQIKIVFHQIFSYYDINAFSAIGFLLLWILIGFTSLISLVYVSMCIGSLFRSHKIIASIVAYIAIYTALQILNTILLLATPVFGDLLSISSNNSLPPVLFFQVMRTVLIISLAAICIYNFVSWYIVSKKLNLE